MTTVSTRVMTVAWTQEKARSTGHVARAGESPGSVFLSQNQSQDCHWTFPGTAKKPASSPESALDPLPGADLAAPVCLPQPHCGLYPTPWPVPLPAAGPLPSILVRGRRDGRKNLSQPAGTSLSRSIWVLLHPFCQHRNKQMQLQRCCALPVDSGWSEAFS